MTNTTATAAPRFDRRAVCVHREGYGRVTVAMTRADAETYIAGAIANGGTGYSIHFA